MRTLRGWRVVGIALVEQGQIALRKSRELFIRQTCQSSLLCLFDRLLDLDYSFSEKDFPPHLTGFQNLSGVVPEKHYRKTYSTFFMLRQQLQFARQGNGLCAAAHAQLAIDRRGIGLHRAKGDEKLVGNGLIGETLGH